MSERPTTLKIGHFTYDIEWIDETTWIREYPTQADKAGFFWHDGNRVCMRTENEGHPTSEDSMRETLVHEVLHACWNQANMKAHGNVDKDDLEEWAVGCLSFPLTAVLIDNPALVKWLRRK